MGRFDATAKDVLDRQWIAVLDFHGIRATCNHGRIWIPAIRAWLYTDPSPSSPCTLGWKRAYGTAIRARPAILASETVSPDRIILFCYDSSDVGGGFGEWEAQFRLDSTGRLVVAVDPNRQDRVFCDARYNILEWTLSVHNAEFRSSRPLTLLP